MMQGLVFEYVSERFCEITGIARAEMLANSNAMAAIIQPGEREAFEQKMLAAVRAARGV